MIIFITNIVKGVCGKKMNKCNKEKTNLFTEDEVRLLVTLNDERFLETIDKLIDRNKKVERFKNIVIIIILLLFGLTIYQYFQHTPIKNQINGNYGNITNNDKHK